MFDAVHHVELAMPRGEEAAARAFFVDVLGMKEIDKPPMLAARGDGCSAPGRSSSISAAVAVAL